MAAGFILNGSSQAISLPDNAAYDVAIQDDSLAMSFWLNPDNTRTAEEVVFDRSGWFKLVLTPDNYAQMTFGDGSIRRWGPIPLAVKTNIIFNFQTQAAIATGTADVNVATLLIDESADWYTNGVDDENPIEGAYLVYNRDDRTFDTGSVIADLAMTASATTVNITDDTISAPGHAFVDGCPVNPVGADVPAGLVADTLVYVGDVDGDNIYLYDTAANAVTNDGSTGLVDLTDVGSGAFTLRAREDAIQLNSDLCPDGDEVVAVFTNLWQAPFSAWINGLRVLNDPINHFNPPADSAEVINVGKLKAGSNWYDGKINNVTLWTPGIVTDAIAIAVWNKGTELTTAVGLQAIDGAMTLLAHWPFDENASSTAVDNDEGTGGLDGTASGNTDTMDTATLDVTEYEVSPNILEFTAAASVTGMFFIKAWEWVGSATADDDLVVNNAAGERLLYVENKIANDKAGEVFPAGRPLETNGITVATIDAGTLRIFLA